MFAKKNLLKNEFFPSELPPCFNTHDLANYAQEVIDIANSFGRKYSIPLTYSGYKSESARRKFAIPNPYHYCKAVDLIVQNEAVINDVFRRSKYSLTAPINKSPKEEQPYSKKTTCVADTKNEIEKAYQNNRYEIRLDINAFFDNVYTHSIPWAIHGIEVSKQRKNDNTLLGNKIDKCMRSMNYDQTNGILVGNAISRIISEIILCTIDSQIQRRFENIECRRFVDDYYIYTSDLTQVQEIISYIRICLSKYELFYNENKIQINESPFLYGKPWVEEIKQYMHLQPEVFLSKLIMEYNQHKDITIIKYGLKVIAQYDFDKNTWPAMQSRLVNLWVKFPSLSDRILPILWNNKTKITRNNFKNAIYSVIDESILLNREQELVWAVWYSKIFNITLSQDCILKVLDANNDMSTIIVLDLVHKYGKENNSKIKQKRKQIHDELSICDIDDGGNPNMLLWTSKWLLAYEATRNKWLDIDTDLFDYASRNQFFSQLLTKNIAFYDPDYQYIAKPSSHNGFEYATKTELKNAFKKLKRAILLLAGENHEEYIDFDDETDVLFTNFVRALEQEEAGYIG